MPALDALQPATADSFDRASALLRAPRPPRGRRRPLALAITLAAAVGACSYPVESDETVGYDIEWTAYGSIDPANYTVEALVPPRQRLAIETRRAERPAVPPDHEYPRGTTWTRVRYSLAASESEAVEALADSMRAIIGVYNLQVSHVVQQRRMPFVAAAFGRLGVAVNPGDEAVSDREVQAFLDDPIARLDLASGELTHRFPPRIERLPDGRRILRHGEAPFAYLLTPATRIWIRPDVPHGPLDVDGITDDEFLFLTKDGWRSRAEGGWGTPVDELSPAVRDSVLNANGLDENAVALPLDSCALHRASVRRCVSESEGMPRSGTPGAILLITDVPNH